MKKIIAGILAAVTVLSASSMAFAATPANSSTVANNVAIRQEVLSSRATIRGNEVTANQLRKDIVATMAKVRQKLTAMKKDPANVTQDQINALKTAIANIKSERATMVSTHKDVLKNLYPTLKAAIKARDYNTIVTQFNAIIAEQQSRISDLQNLLDSVNSVLNI